MKKIFVLIALAAALVPSAFTVYKAGGLDNWQGVLPRGTTDSLYYYARIREVVDGHPFIGHPYAYEYRGTLSPAFFLPDIVSAIPMLLGLPFNIGVVTNVFIWSFVFLALAFALFKLLQMPKWWALAWSVILYITAYSFMLRPTVMQLTYPMFLAFLIALLKFLYEPLSRRRGIWLAVAAASTFYVYTFLSYIVILTFTFIFFWFLFIRRFKELRAFIIVGIFTGLMLIPFGIYAFSQMTNPYYLETVTRLGLVYTHMPAMDAFLYGRWVMIGLIAFELFWFLFPKQEEESVSRRIFWLSTGIALFAGLFLNVITGVELTLAVHVGRFVILWMVLALGVLLYEWHSSKLPGMNKAKYAIAGIFILVFSLGAIKNISRGLDFFKFDNRGDKIADVQAYGPLLKWLDENVAEESVVWANKSISEYIPIETRHYPLFFHGAVLHNISNQELEERFLLSKSMEILTAGDLKRDFGRYAGAGPNKEQPRVLNEKSWLCEQISRFIANRECPPSTDAIALRGEEYFKRLEERFGIIKKNQAAFLRQFNAKYLIVDRANDNLGNISLKEALYDDGRFVVLTLPLFK